VCLLVFNAVLLQLQSKPKGRGPGTGKGKTATRGHKGRRARSGGSVRIGFEGGQTPLYLRLPKYGFKRTMLQQPLEVITLSKLQLMIDQGRLDASKTITIPDLVACGVLRRVRHGVKLLATVSLLVLSWLAHALSVQEAEWLCCFLAFCASRHRQSEQPEARRETSTCFSHVMLTDG
jgi:ribosomal protein L15